MTNEMSETYTADSKAVFQLVKVEIEKLNSPRPETWQHDRWCVSVDGYTLTVQPKYKKYSGATGEVELRLTSDRYHHRGFHPRAFTVTKLSWDGKGGCTSSILSGKIVEICKKVDGLARDHKESAEWAAEYRRQATSEAERSRAGQLAELGEDFGKALRLRVDRHPDKPEYKVDVPAFSVSGLAPEGVKALLTMLTAIRHGQRCEVCHDGNVTTYPSQGPATTAPCTACGATGKIQ